MAQNTNLDSSEVTKSYWKRSSPFPSANRCSRYGVLRHGGLPGGITHTQPGEEHLSQHSTSYCNKHSCHVMLSAIDGASTSTLESGLRGLRVLSRPLFRSHVSRAGMIWTGRRLGVHNTRHLPSIQDLHHVLHLLKTVRRLLILWPSRHSASRTHECSSVTPVELK